MDTEVIAQLAAAGIALGIIEGIKPGPLLTMVIRESLSKGLKAGMWTAAAPIFTDGPMIIASLFLAGWMATQPPILFSISLLGALFLAKMGFECFSLEPPDPDSEPDTSGSFKRGVLTNLLN
ncbi:MAG: LysE family transporter, partial [Candidatus Thalassarchaeaceae archaeon]|nr:LysE family transporter [Candidatus Thalassarchaeaceae archaeon]